jgi:hypothetical protein
MIECSVAELRERLELNKRKLQQEIDFKREQNLAKKEREAVTLIEDAKKIEEARKRLLRREKPLVLPPVRRDSSKSTTKYRIKRKSSVTRRRDLPKN